MTGATSARMGEAMNGKLMVPVPALVTAWYLVPAAVAAGEARTIAVAVADEADRMLIDDSERGLTVAVSSTVAGGGSFRRPEFVSDRNLVSFRVSCRTGFTASHELIGRTLAAGLAAEVSAAAIADAVGGQWICPDEARASLHVKEDGSLRLSDWVRVAAAPDRARRVVSLETVGLRRYGLPELRVADVPSRFGDGWSVALTGLAWQVRQALLGAVYDATPLGELPSRTQAPATFAIPAEFRLSADDVASAYCLRGVSGPLASLIGLGLDHDAAGTFLTIGPPHDWSWSQRAFLESVAEGPLKPVLKAARVFDDLVTGNVDLEEFAVRF